MQRLQVRLGTKTNCAGLQLDFAAGRIEVLDWENAKKELRGRFE